MEKPAVESKCKAKKPKKPWAYKKADLNLEEYKKEILDKSPSVLFRRGCNAVLYSWKFYLYLVMQAIAAGCGCGQIMFCIGRSTLSTSRLTRPCG